MGASRSPRVAVAKRETATENPDMNEDMQQEATDYVTQALEK